MDSLAFKFFSPGANGDDDIINVRIIILQNARYTPLYKMLSAAASGRCFGLDINDLGEGTLGQPEASLHTHVSASVEFENSQLAAMEDNKYYM